MWWAGSSRLRVLPSGVQPAVWWRNILLVLVFFPLVENDVFFCGERCRWPGWDYPSFFRLNETFSEMKRLVLSFPPGSCRRSCSLRIPPGKRNNKTPLFQNMAHFPCLLMKNAFLLLLPFGCKGVCRSKRFVSVKKKKDGTKDAGQAMNSSLPLWYFKVCSQNINSTDQRDLLSNLGHPDLFYFNESSWFSLFGYNFSNLFIQM